MPKDKSFEVAAHFNDVPRRYACKQAILIYKDEQGDCAASIHEVAGAQPGLQPGQPVTIAALEALLTALGRRGGGGFIAPEILSVGLDSLAWWRPSAYRRIWFKPHSDDANAKQMRQLNGKHIWYPPLLFKARPDALSVFALVANERPRRDTRLWKAPFWNLNEGGMCNGDIKLPPVAADNIGRFHTAFFDSAFTHNSQGGMLTVHPGGYIGLLEALAKRKTKPDTAFWCANLIRTKQQVQTQINHHE